MLVHEYREGLMLGDSRVATSSTQVAVWRSWETVEGAVAPIRERSQQDPFPERTVRRRRARLVASAAALVVVLGTASSTMAALARVIAKAVSTGRGMEFVKVMSAR
jgi:hypothetical protein